MNASVGLFHVTKRFGAQTVLDDLSLSFPRGRASCVMGPSGCGKTTLLRLLMRLDAPDAGRVVCPGRVSAVFQEDRLIPALTAPGNLRFALGRGFGAQGETMLGELGLRDSLDKPAHLLSGGMQRRVAIARALLAEHGVLLLDEPFKGLDWPLKERVAGIICRNEAGRTVVLVTHDPKEAELLDAELFRLP